MTESVTLPYLQQSYDTKKRFCSYWHQIDEVRKAAPDKILEIGVGNGFISHYLKRLGFKVTTLDIEAELKPDVQASAEEMPFENNSFPLVICCEVLEHMPYEKAEKALCEIGRVAKDAAIISIPDRTKAYPFMGYLPLLGIVQFLLPWWRPAPRYTAGPEAEHKWEIGYRDWPLKRIKESMRKNGLKITRTYRVFEHIKHRFFILKPDEQSGDN